MWHDAVNEPAEPAPTGATTRLSPAWLLTIVVLPRIVFWTELGSNVATAARSMMRAGLPLDILAGVVAVVVSALALGWFA